MMHVDSLQRYRRENSAGPRGWSTFPPVPSVSNCVEHVTKVTVLVARTLVSSLVTGPEF